MPPLPIAVFGEREAELLSDLRALVEIESPTPHKTGLDQLGRSVARSMEALGANVRRFRQDEAGDHWVGAWGPNEGGILLMAHLDTVHPVGTLSRFPWSEAGERIYGPGILDMKSSVAIALAALRALREHDRMPDQRLSLLCTSDEETGSHTSAQLIRELAQEHELVLCLEPALPDGALKTWRKGTGMFDLEVRGKAAHAGANPDDGINAIHEAALLIPQLTELADEAKGTTINVGLIRGGTRTNVIPALCRAKLDVRVQVPEEQARLDRALTMLKPAHPDAVITIQGEWNRPPMPRTPAMVETFQRARMIAEQLDLELSEGGTGGGSDANFVAPLGVPLLDGLGAVGGGAHTEGEFVLRNSLAERAALLAAILSEW